jgi:hypothetical protein
LLYELERMNIVIGWQILPEPPGVTMSSLK